jgi:hypothetical protein
MSDQNINVILDELDASDVLVGRAKETLEATLRDLKLTPEEERAMADEVNSLQELSKKLDENTIEIAAFGMVSRGKSSVLNALLGKEVFQSGATHGTTVQKVSQRWEHNAPLPGGYEEAKLVLVDTPGIDEVGGEVREKLAKDVVRRADLILFVISSDMQRREFEALEQLREAQKPMIVVFNQIDRYPDVDRDQIYAKISNDRVRHLVRPSDVVMTAAKPDPYRVKTKHADGSVTTAWEYPPPVIESLKARILEVLESEGKELIALNTLLYAGDLHDDIIKHKVRIRDDAANRMIWNFAIAKGAAVAINPIPVADMAGGLAVDVGMIVALSKVYGIALTKQTAIGLIKDMIKALGALGAVEVVTKLLASGVKATLGGITVLSGALALPLTALGYTAIGVAQGAAAAGTSYVLGQAAKFYLQQGCQWGPRGIKTVIADILEQAKSDSVIERLRDDLKKKVVK